MIIKSLTLKDFRQFCGEQTITFSTDPVKKVTLVIAESGVGKTTLGQAFKWIFYGESKYKSVLNHEIGERLGPSQKTYVEGKIVISHENKEYTIKRKQGFFKAQVRIDPLDSDFTVDYKDTDGIDRQLRGYEATTFIKGIMHKDLFPYFFLEGESLTKVGEQMARGKSGANKEFSNAIKGLLGFNHLYEASKHLKNVSDDYSKDIARLTTNNKLKENIENLSKVEESISKAKKRISQIDTEIEYYANLRDEYGEKVQANKEVENKQRRTKMLAQQLADLQKRINLQKKVIFNKFSRDGIFPILDSMLLEAKRTLKNADGLDKGIPGMDVSAIKYMLDNHRCVCGDEILEGSKEWEALTKLITYLPPNNIGYEIKTFESQMETISKSASVFKEDFKHERKALNDLIDDYNSKSSELTRLNEEIGGVSEDISVLKSKEQEFSSKVTNLRFERRDLDRDISTLENNRASLKDQQKVYQQYDEKTQKLQMFKGKADWLKTKIDLHCSKKENEKRAALEKAINDIFADFYTESIHFKLDNNYGVQITTSTKELSEDFTSGGQDVAVALAFIGAIIKVNTEKSPSTDQMDEDEKTEAYPLVLDAPVSAFGMKQMDSFSEVMPSIADQIIVFINDKDGPILREKLGAKIGSKWIVVQEQGDSYHSYIKEANGND